ncbi:MAG: ATP-binding protein [Oscillibacter sp.]|nr:ATP-binding protein [Oscillibacter sp.]
MSFALDWVENEGENTAKFSCRAGLGPYRITARGHSKKTAEKRTPDLAPKPVWRWLTNQFIYKKDGDTLFDRGLPPSITPLDMYFLSGFSNDIFAQHAGDSGIDAYEKFRQYIASYGIYQPTTPVLRGTIPDPNQTEPVGLNGGRLAEAMKELIRTDEEGDSYFGSLYMDDVLEMIDWLQSVKITEPKKSTLNANIPTTRNVIEFQDRYMKSTARFTAYDASEGALYVFFLLSLAMHPDAPPVFAVDNFDQALNPRLARHLTETFCELILEQKKQVFLTTHNPLVLDGLDLSNDDIRLFTVERDSESGKTNVKRVELTTNLLKQEQPASRLWVNGLLGGVPLL